MAATEDESNQGGGVFIGAPDIISIGCALEAPLNTAFGGGVEIGSNSQYNGEIYIGTSMTTGQRNIEIGSVYDCFRTYISGEQLRFQNTTRNHAMTMKVSEETITIPIGQGLGGVVSTTTMIPANSFIIGLGYEVTQSGGVSSLSIGPTSGAANEFINNGSTPWGRSFEDSGGLTGGHMWSGGSSDTITVTTNINVTGPAMTIYVAIWYWQIAWY